MVFGHAGIERQDPDYYAAHVANYILGGGGFSSRLLEEVREKRGLAYSAYSYLARAGRGAARGWAAWRPTTSRWHNPGDRARRARAHGAGRSRRADLADAKTYLTGSFPLRLTSNDQVAKMLVGMLVHDLGQDFLERRNDLIEAVTLDDLKRVSARLFSGELLVNVVGDPGRPVTDPAI